MDFSTDFEPNHGSAVTVYDRVLRITAPNGGPFTFHGTNTYIVGCSELIVIDPGPDDDFHLVSLLKAIAGRPVTHILVTHTHADHSPLTDRLQRATGALTAGFGPHTPARPLHIDESNALDASVDKKFVPEIMLRNGAFVSNAENSIQAIHTPGHLSNHLCFALSGTPVLFSGDHIMAWATTIVAPPDGSMADYLKSIEKLRKRRETFYLPGHGGPVTRPGSFLRALKAHRLMREAAILDLLSQGPKNIHDIVATIYRDTDKRLHGAAALTVFAHLERLIELGAVSAIGTASLEAIYIRTA